MTTFLVENKEYSLSDIYQYINDRPKLILSEEIQSQINASCKVLDNAVSEDKVIYGVSKGANICQKGVDVHQKGVYISTTWVCIC